MNFPHWISAAQQGFRFLTVTVSLPFLLSSMTPQPHIVGTAALQQWPGPRRGILWAARMCLDKAHRLFLPHCWRVMNQQTGRRSHVSPGNRFFLGLAILSGSSRVLIMRKKDRQCGISSNLIYGQFKNVIIQKSVYIHRVSFVVYLLNIKLILSSWI